MTFCRKAFWRWWLATALIFACNISKAALAEGQMHFAYGGRLVQANGAPVAGPVALRVRFYHDATGQVPILTVTDGLEDVGLQQGIFQFNLAMSVADYDKVFSDPAQDVWVQVTDLTHSSTKPFPVQQLQLVPYAAKIPVDGATLSFNSDGKLALGPASAPGANQFLTKDGSGKLIWGTPTTSASALQGQDISSIAPAAGQVLQFNGTQWVPAAAGAASGVTAITATAPLATSGSAATPTVLIARATSISAGYLAAADWLAFNGKLATSGGTMNGALNMGSQTLTGLASPFNATDAATKAYVDAATAGGGAATNIVGTGDGTATPGAGLLRGATAAGSNIAGAPVTLTAGNGTGTGGSGPLYLQTAAAAASGSTVDTLATRLTITAAGNVGVGTTNPGSLLDIAGALTQRASAAPALSSVGQGVLYFDSAAAQFKVSQSGGAFVALTGNGAGSVTSITGGPDPAPAGDPARQWHPEHRPAAWPFRGTDHQRDAERIGSADPEWNVCCRWRFDHERGVDAAEQWVGGGNESVRARWGECRDWHDGSCLQAPGFGSNRLRRARRGVGSDKLEQWQQN